MSQLRSRIEALSRGFRGAVNAAGWRLLIDILVELDRRSTLAVGPGLQLRSASAGQELRVRAGGATGNAAAPRETDGTPTEIDAVFGTRDTDTWEARDGKLAKLQVLTDIWYDTTDHKLLARTRELQITAYGRVIAIGAESEPATLIIELAECEAQPEAI